MQASQTRDQKYKQTHTHTHTNKQTNRSEPIHHSMTLKRAKNNDDNTIEGNAR